MSADDEPTRPAVVFDPERHLDHARICPACGSLLQRTERGWTCEQRECPVEMTDEEMERALGRATRPNLDASTAGSGGR